jgi:hypothetical protein
MAIRARPVRRGRAEAERAAGGPAARVLARAGLAARGVIYILIGWVAVLVALGHTARPANQQGALQLLAGQPLGGVLLWLLGAGFAGYALWQLSQAAFGVAGEGRRAGPRLRSLGKAAIYAGLSYLTFAIVAGAGERSQTHRQQDLTANVMRHTGGQWLVGIAGLIVVIVGVALVAEGSTRRFLRYLTATQMSRRTLRVVTALGAVGSVARGLVLMLAGALVIDAAATHRPAESGGLDKALLTLRDQPFGGFLLLAAAVGLIIFGLYGLCEVRWRKV